jgi:hypothetical protein
MPPEIAGKLSTNPRGLNVFDTSEAAEVLRMFSRITDHGVRESFKDLAKNLARNDT